MTRTKLNKLQREHNDIDRNPPLRRSACIIRTGQ